MEGYNVTLLDEGLDCSNLFNMLPHRGGSPRLRTLLKFLKSKAKVSVDAPVAPIATLLEVFIAAAPEHDYLCNQVYLKLGQCWETYFVNPVLQADGVVPEFDDKYSLSFKSIDRCDQVASEYGGMDRACFNYVENGKDVCRGHFSYSYSGDGGYTGLSTHYTVISLPSTGWGFNAVPQVTGALPFVM